MGQTTDIQWCDSTINPTSGCDGCELKAPGKPGTCYAVPIHVNRLARTMPDKYAADFHEVREIPGRMNQISKWSDLRGKDRPDKPWLNGMPRTIFVGDLGDLFSRDVSFEFIRDELVAQAIAGNGGRHIQMWLTKQPERMVQFSQWLYEQRISWPDNIWAGVSVTTQRTADLRIPQLLNVPAKVRFLSMEPQLEEIDISRWLCSTSITCRCGHKFEAYQADFCEGHPQSTLIDPCLRTLKCPSCNACVCANAVAWKTRQAHGIDTIEPGTGRFDFVKKGYDWKSPIHWVIQGGESGPMARPFNFGYARKTRDQCQEAGVHYFFKQAGPHPFGTSLGIISRLKMQDSHGGDPSEWPEDLRVREIPEVAG